jgi:hypothetical protein
LKADTEALPTDSALARIIRIRRRAHLLARGRIDGEIENGDQHCGGSFRPFAC